VRFALPLILALACDVQDLDNTTRPSAARRCDIEQGSVSLAQHLEGARPVRRV